MTNNIFGEEFELKIPIKDARKAVQRATPKKVEITDENIEKKLASKSVPIKDKLSAINTKVLKVLGKQKNNVSVIETKEELNSYIDKCILAGRIAIDTETNNSLDPVTCKIMGLCLYSPGQKQAYIPVNHVNIDTMERLPKQCTEEDCKEALQKIIDAKTFVVMHNGKFDYEVLKCTCGIEVVPNWDTIIAARLLNENEEAGLKYQYTKKIDPRQSKYDIEGLFETVPYAYVDPNIFALYAATDSMMTDKLYEYQKQFFDSPDYERLRWLFENIEMPIVKVTGDMELRGVSVDTEFGEKLSEKYNKQLEEVDKKIQEEFDSLKSKIDVWKLSKEANEKTKQYVPKKTVLTPSKIEEKYPFTEKDGRRYKLTKPKVEQISDPINFGSPIQLAILIYDILGCKPVDKNSPRATGEEELKALSKKAEDSGNPIPICDLIIKRRGITKLISTYISVIPSLAKHWPDGRIRFHLNSMGTDTGRYSSGGKIKFMEDDNQVVLSGINIQNIPSHSKEIRMLFKARLDTAEITIEDNEPFVIPEYTEIETPDGFKYPKDLNAGDTIIVDGLSTAITEINYVEENKTYRLIA